TDDRLDQAAAPRQGKARQALLPARPARQEGAHRRGPGTRRRRGGDRKRVVSAPMPERRRKLGGSCIGLLSLSAVVWLWSAAVFAGEVLVIEVKTADARIDPQTKQSVIFVKLTEESKRLIAEMTQKNIGRTTEFRVDGRVLMKPVIREPLLAGVFE